MTISTTDTSTLIMPGKRSAYLYALVLVLPGIVLTWETARRKRHGPRNIFAFVILFWLAIFLVSCGGGSSSPNSTSTTTLVTTNYTITITGMSGSLSSSTNVGLIVEAP
jgi:hypothetical protein